MALNVTGGGLEFTSTLDLTQVQEGIRRLEAQLKGLNTTVRKEGDEFDNFAKRASAALGGFFAVQASKDFLNDIIRVRSEFAKTEAVLANSLGSENAAQKAMDMLTEYASKTPFQLSEVSAAYVKLVNQGLKPTERELIQLGDLAASTGKGFDQLAEAVIDAQTGEFERLKEFGIRAEKAGDQVKFTFKGVETQVKFTSESIKDYITSLGNVQGVANSTAKISAELGGALSNLEDAIDKALNRAGKASEGMLKDGITAATALVENYERISDAIQVLIISYGSYRAAVLLTVAAQNIHGRMLVQNALATNALTKSQQLGAVATIAWQGAMKSLNALLLANAPMLAVAGLVTLIGTLTFLKDETYQVVEATERLQKAQEAATVDFSRQEAEIKSYVKVLGDQNVAESTRLEAYNKLKQIAPDIIGQLSFQAAKTKNLTDETNAYLASLKQSILLEQKRSQYAEALSDKQKKLDAAKPFMGKDGKTKGGGFLDVLNPFTESSLLGGSEGDQRLKAYQQSAQAVIDIENDISKSLRATSKEGVNFRIEQLQNEQKFLDKRSAAYKKNEEEIASLQRTLASSGNNAAQQTTVRNEAFLKAEIERLKTLRAPFATLSKEYANYTKQIEALEKELNPFKTARSQQAANNKAEEELNRLIEQRKGILQSIADLQRDAKQSGLQKDASELDKINEKYDTLFRKITEFNEKAKKGNTQGIGLADIQKLEQARANELANQNLKDDAARYVKQMEAQREIFERYEVAKKEIGIEQAAQMFAGQTKGFDNYLQYLQAEAAKIAPKIVFGVANVGDASKFAALSKEITAAQKQQAQADAARISQLLTLTSSYNDKTKLIEQARIRDVALLQKKYTGEDLKQRLAALNTFYDKQQDQLREELLKLSPLYEKLGESLLSFSRDKLKSRAKELRKILADGFVEVDKGGGVLEVVKLTPQMIADLKSGIESTNGLIESTGTLFGISVDNLDKMASTAGRVSGILSGLASDMRPFDNGLANTLEQMAQMAQLAGTLAQGAASFASGDYLGAATAGASAIGQIAGIFAASKKSAQEARDAVQQFYQTIQFSEIQAAISMRERLALEAKLKGATLDRLEAERKALEENKRASQAQYDQLLKQLQGEQYVKEQSTKKGRGSAIFGLVGVLTGLGGQTSVQNQMASLSGMNYEQLEKLFNSGQLTDKAKDLFQQLQKLKQEGLDIDQQIRDLKSEAQQIYTGSTAEGITDSIADGFANGFRSVADFADKTEDIIQKAMLNALKYKALEGPIQKLYEQFAADAEDGGGLDNTEVQSFTESLNKTIQNAAAMAEQIEKATGISLSGMQGGAGGANNLTGAIKGMTAQQADLLAGQFGGLRITNLEMLKVGQLSLSVHQNIEANTAATVARLDRLISKFDQYETGARRIAVQ